MSHDAATNVLDGNSDLAARAEAVIPGGVNSINRKLPWPLAVTSARGATFTDCEGKEYIDFHAAYGPVVLGHADPGVNEAVKQAIDRTSLIGAGVTDLEIELAERLVKCVPSAESVLLTNSGSEATYAAIRLARAYTGRDLLIKFQGAYHGWHDAVLMNVISSANRLHSHDLLSEGMNREVTEKTIILPFNDSEALAEAFDQLGPQIAAVIVEVIQHNIGCVIPTASFLESLRTLTTKHDALLIFDEVVTGFRHGVGGYQAQAGVLPDLTTLAKAIANGYPIAALAGKAEIMALFAEGRVAFAGTFNGNPVGVAAALATTSALMDGKIVATATERARSMSTEIQRMADEAGLPMTCVSFGSVFTPYFFDGPTTNYEDLLANDSELDIWFRSEMCARGIFMIPTPLKRNHISAAHTDEQLERTLETVSVVMREGPPLKMVRKTSVKGNS